MKHIIWAMLLLSLSQPGLAAVYTDVLDESRWQVEESIFACRLWHPAKTYGEAVFETRAGEASRFFLQSRQNRFKPGQAQILASSPVWMSVRDKVLLAEVRLAEGPEGVSADSSQTESMLLQLYYGRDVLVSQRGRPDALELGELVMPVVGFRPAYKIYRDCLTGLLPVNFDQVKRTAVYFGSDQYLDLPATELAKLDTVALYATADSSVKEVYIDGHTDNVDGMQYNLELAEKRADEVKRYLMARGVPEQAIISRWHGERYPVDSNKSADGRAKNRRVTVRLERADAIKTLAR